MISLLTVATALAPLAAEPAAVHSQELSVRVRPTSIRVLNPAQEPRLLIFESTANGPSEVLWLAPDGEYTAHFPLGTLDDMRLEVVLADPNRWRSSEAIRLGRLLTGGDYVLELHDFGNHLQFFAHSRQGTRAVDASGYLLPGTRTLGGGTQNSTAAAGSTTRTGSAGHVPVVPPRDNRRTNGPPKVGGKPLPPV